PAPVLVEEPSDGGGGRHGGVADDVSGTARGQTPVDQAPHDVVDAGPGDARPPGDFRGGERVPTQQGDVRLGFVGGETQTRQLGDALRGSLHRATLRDRRTRAQAPVSSRAPNRSASLPTRSVTGCGGRSPRLRCRSDTGEETLYSRTGRGLVAAALMAIVLAACRGDGAAVDTTPSTEPPPATATTATTAPPATTTTLPAPTTSTEPENVDPLGWEPVEVAELTRDEQGSGRIGAILSTPSGGWLIGGSVNVDVGMPRPMVWLSDDGTDWEAKELPAPDRGSTIEAGAWNGEAGLFAGRRGSAAGDTLTVLWLVDESGSGEILESVVFPPNMSDLQIEAQPDGGFVLAGWASDRQYVFRSPDGREWTEDTTADEILAGLTYPYIADLAVGELGLLAVVVDERGANDLGVLLIDRGEGFQEAARIEHETDIDLNGAVVTGAQYQVYGAVRNGPGYESTIWTPRDGEEWTSVTPDISIADSHTSYNTYGSRFVDAVRSSEGLVGVVFDAASYLFVGSQDGTNWSEIPIGGGIPDTAVPPPDRMAVSGGVVLAASSSITEPALFRIAKGSATQVVHDALPTSPELVRLPAGTSTDDGVVFIVDRQRLAPSLAEEPDLSARAVAVSVDGDVVSSEPMPDLFMSDVVVTEDGVAVVGYER